MSSDSVGEKNKKRDFQRRQSTFLSEDSREWRNSTICSALDGGSAVLAWIRKAQTSSCHAWELLTDSCHLRLGFGISYHELLWQPTLIKSRAMRRHFLPVSACNHEATITMNLRFYCQCQRSPTASMKISFLLFSCAQNMNFSFSSRLIEKLQKNGKPLPTCGHFRANLHARSRSAKKSPSFHSNRKSVPELSKKQEHDANACEIPNANWKTLSTAHFGFCQHWL